MLFDVVSLLFGVCCGSQIVSMLSWVFLFCVVCSLLSVVCVVRCSSLLLVVCCPWLVVVRCSVCGCVLSVLRCALLVDCCLSLSVVCC